jgi:hypothetical protein
MNRRACQAFGSTKPALSDADHRGSVALVLRIVGVTVYPFAVDGQVLSILDAKYTAICTPRAFAAVVRYVLRLRRDVRADEVAIAVVSSHVRQQTAALVEAIRAAVERAGMAMHTVSADTCWTGPISRVVDRRLAWELVAILNDRRIDRSANPPPSPRS